MDARDLIDPLLKRTQEGQVKWNTVVGDEDKAFTRLGSYVVEVGPDFDGDPCLIVRDAQGLQLDGAYAAKGSPTNRSLDELLGAARRNALGADKAIAEIMMILNKNR